MKLEYKNGFALVTVIVFSAVAMLIITAGVSLSLITTQSNQAFNAGQRALALAEAGAEEAILKLIRNPEYTGETIGADVLNIDGGTAIINISDNAGIKVITVDGQVVGAKRRVVVEVDDSSGMMVVNSWQEQF
ncbi:MAG TPA: hypothetical protein PKX78_03010 [Candidatus Woesebacteria bacterium]|nr:hypothetical protein [Candidatus Woesebacteria bacterium]